MAAVVVGNHRICLRCRQVNRTEARYCRTCGERIGPIKSVPLDCRQCVTDAQDPYCAACGRLRPGCRMHCGEVYAPRARHCRRCGTRLSGADPFLESIE